MSFLMVAAGLLTISAASAAKPEPGWFGVTYTIHAHGLFHPTIESVYVASVHPSSPSAQAQLGIGDELLAVDDHTVAGIEAQELRGLMNKSVGESVTLRLRRVTGEIFTAVLIAAPLRKS